MLQRKVITCYVEENEVKLNVEQQVYEEIFQRFNSEEGRVHFLDAPGGTGKTFLINLLL